MGTGVFWVTIIKCINLLIGRKLKPVKDCIFDLYGLGCLLAMCKKNEICDFVVQNKVASQEGAAVRNRETLESGKLKLVPNAYISIPYTVNPVYKSHIIPPCFCPRRENRASVFDVCWYLSCSHIGGWGGLITFYELAAACVTSDTLLMLRSQPLSCNIWEAKWSSQAKVSIPHKTFVEMQNTCREFIGDTKKAPENEILKSWKNSWRRCGEWWFSQQNAHFVSANIPPAGM